MLPLVLRRCLAPQAVIFLIIQTPQFTRAQSAGAPSTITPIDSTAALPAHAFQQKNQLLDFKNTEIKDIVRSLATKYNLNVYIANDVTTRATLRLVDVTVEEALHFLVNENGLAMTIAGNLCKIFPPEIPQPEPKPLAISFANGLLSVDLQNEELEKVTRALAEKSKHNLIVQQGVSGKVSGFLQEVAFEPGLLALMASNGFSVRKREGLYLIEQNERASNGVTRGAGNAAWITREDSLLTLAITGGDLDQLVRELAEEMNVGLFVYGNLSGKVNAQCARVPFEQALSYLLKGTSYTYRKEGGIYLIGDKNVSGIASTKLVRLQHMKSEGLLDLMPATLKNTATLQVIKEQNGLLVMGSPDLIREVETFVAQIDHPSAQILIEALVVDFNTSDLGELGMNAGMKAPNDTTAQGGDSIFPFVDFTASAGVLNQALQYYGEQFGVKNIGKLPDRFYLHLRALEKKGKANVRSQPQIATLNGHPASLKIGTTQYFILRSQQPLVGGNQVINQITERFEKITAEISLTITPWVSASGEITTEIKPEFSTPQGVLDPQVPPTINHRTLNSTVRLRDGETIVLGGLVQNFDNENIDKFPLLGSLPLLGRLFQNRSHNRSKSELIIYVTPHLYYTEGADYRSGVLR